VPKREVCSWSKCKKMRGRKLICEWWKSIPCNWGQSYMRVMEEHSLQLGSIPWLPSKPQQHIAPWKFAILTARHCVVEKHNRPCISPCSFVYLGWHESPKRAGTGFYYFTKEILYIAVYMFKLVYIINY
jgi:hypothetical protein